MIVHCPERVAQLHAPIPWGYSVQMGCIGAVSWLGAQGIAQYLQFTSVALDDWAAVLGGMTAGWSFWWTVVAGALVLTVFSLLLTMGYAVSSRSFPVEAWPGMMFGVLAFVIGYVVLPLVVTEHPAVWHMTVTTFCTELCVWLLWGTLVGYSIQWHRKQRVASPMSTTPKAI